jgi:glucosamine-6-phosphate deaminase
MQGGQGEVKHWAFNDPPQRSGKWKNDPPPPAEYRKLKTRIVDLHPMTVIQNARTSGGGYVAGVPTQACSVGPGRDLEGRAREHLARRHARQPVRHAPHRLDDQQTVARFIDADVAVGGSSQRHFHYYRPAIGTVAAEMH